MDYSYYSFKVEYSYISVRWTGTKEKYEKEYGRKDFGTIVDDNTTAIQHLTTDTATGARYYTLDGRELTGNPTARGIYIVCPDNGGPQGLNARKIIIK